MGQTSLSTMHKQTALLLACMAVLSTGQESMMTCEECTNLNNAMAAFSTDENSIKGQLDIITGPVCENSPPEDMCEDLLPEFWERIASGLFSTEGWWNAERNCVDVCSEAKTPAVKEIYCEECSFRINASIEYLGDEETILEVIAAFQDSMFCSGYYPDAVEDCMEGLEYVIPIAFQALYEVDRAWIGDFCSNTMSCM